jgi:hypothetical protein
VTSPQAFDGLRLADRPVRRVDLTLATEDHNTPTGYADPAFNTRRGDLLTIADTTSRVIGEGRVHPRTISEVFSSFARANFRVDTVLEPEPTTPGPRSAQWHDHMRFVPATLIIRARKQGI